MTISIESRGADVLDIFRVDNYSGFLQLREQWNELVANRSVFLRHEWFDAAWQWRRLDETVQLAILCAYRGTNLVGVCPLIQVVGQISGIRRWILEFLTVPDNQSCDLIAAESEQTAVADSIAATLSAQRGEWDVLHLSYLPEDSLVRSALTQALRAHGIAYRINDGGSNPYISLKTDWNEYYATRSRRLKKASNLNSNRLTRAGNICIDWLQPGNTSAAETRSALESVIAISADSWKRSTGNTLDYPGPQAFIRRLSDLAQQQGWLSLWLLMLDGKPMAMEYQLVFAGKVHALRADFVDGHDEISPGSHLNRQQLEQLFGRGLQRYLMGPGGNAYKKHWSENEEPLYQLDAYSPSARGRLAALWDLKMKPALHALKAKLPQFNSGIAT